MSEIEKLVYRLEKLVVSINQTNLQARIPEGQSLMEAIATRDMLKLHQASDY